MTLDDIKTGYCWIDGYYAFVRKVTKRPEGKSTVCYFKGTFSGQICEKEEDFLKRKYELVKKTI